MIWRCLDSLMVLAAFAAAYIIPPHLVMRRLYPSAERSFLFVVSAGLGLSSQAILGLFWNHLAAPSPAVEACLYYLFWLTTGLALLWRKRSSPLPPAPCPLNSPLPLLSLILLAAVLLRSFDALDHASLGQSDAYTHLQFLRDVIRQGHLRNIVYPPGYSWALALPTMTFNLDAYMVARYAGPFFGALMVATLYLLGCRHTRTTGLLAALLAATCPLLYPLIKTGMGAFANQLGLFLLPLALLLYVNSSAMPGYRVLFSIILLGLAASVPLFVFTLALIVLLNWLLSCSVVKLSGNHPNPSPSTTQQLNNSTTGRIKRWLREALPLLLPFLLAVALAGYQFLSPGSRHIYTTASLVTGIQSPSSKPQSPGEKPPSILNRVKAYPLGKLAVDLLTVKRMGLGSSLMNVAVLGLAVIFAGILVAGLPGRLAEPVHSKGSDLFKLVGCWGLLTTLQAATGFLEFSFYQRSGWPLLQAVALAGGIISTAMIQFEKTKNILRPLVGAGFLACLLLAFWSPPQHRCITSGAENELATVLRELSAARINALNTRHPLSFERPQASPLILSAASAPRLTVITRRYTLFNADQGNMADALPDPAAKLRQIPVETDSRLNPRTDHFLCLIDRSSGLPDMGLLDRISPALTQSLAGWQTRLYQPNEVILAFLRALPPDAWRVTREDRGNNLSLYFAERLSGYSATDTLRR